MNKDKNPHRIIGKDIHKVTTLTSFCEKIIVKVEGFRDLEHFYDEATCIRNMKDIRIPVFYLNAEDDPIVGTKAIPLNHKNDNILIGITKSGGHLGYFEGIIVPHRQWFP
jgi:predicted alpha/beta-fold hydrolase